MAPEPERNLLGHNACRHCKAKKYALAFTIVLLGFIIGFQALLMNIQLRHLKIARCRLGIPSLERNTTSGKEWTVCNTLAWGLQLGSPVAGVLARSAYCPAEDYTITSCSAVVTVGSTMAGQYVAHYVKKYACGENSDPLDAYGSSNTNDESWYTARPSSVEGHRCREYSDCS